MTPWTPRSQAAPGFAGRFVALGDQLVRQLRAADDRPAATCVAALRRPTVSVWVAIQLAGAAPNALAELLEAGAALVRAQ